MERHRKNIGKAREVGRKTRKGKRKYELLQRDADILYQTLKKAAVVDK